MLRSSLFARTYGLLRSACTTAQRGQSILCFKRPSQDVKLFKSSAIKEALFTLKS